MRHILVFTSKRKDNRFKLKACVFSFCFAVVLVFLGGFFGLHFQISYSGANSFGRTQSAARMDLVSALRRPGRITEMTAKMKKKKVMSIISIFLVI